MSSGERKEGNELSEHQEPEPEPYIRAARFADERPSWLCYERAQRLIADSEADISTYRFQLNRVWHVAIVAAVPPDHALQKQVDSVLAAGTPSYIPDEVVATLLLRHAQAMASGAEWLEGHYRPGETL